MEEAWGNASNSELQYYKILEVEPGTCFPEIKKAYYHRVQEYHPDKVAHLGAVLRTVAEQKMKEINEAYSYFKKRCK